MLPAPDPRNEPEDFGNYDGPHSVELGSLFQRGMPATCICGWHPANHPGFVVADHLQDMEAPPERYPSDAASSTGKHAVARGTGR